MQLMSPSRKSEFVALLSGRGRQKSCNRPCSALTLRGPSGGHCVELQLRPVSGRRQWARRAHCLLAYPRVCEAQMKAPRSGPRRAPGGSVQEGGSVTRLLTAPSVAAGRYSRREYNITSLREMLHTAARTRIHPDSNLFIAFCTSITPHDSRARVAFSHRRHRRASNVSSNKQGESTWEGWTGR